MESNPQLTKIVLNYLNSKCSINLTKNTIEYVDIFNQKVNHSLSDNIFVYDSEKDVVVRAKIAIFKYESRNSTTDYCYKMLLFFNDETHYEDVLDFSAEQALRSALHPYTLQSIYFSGNTFKNDDKSKERLKNTISSYGYNSVSKVLMYLYPKSSSEQTIIETSNNNFHILFSSHRKNLFIPKLLIASRHINNSITRSNFKISQLEISGNNAFVSKTYHLFNVENHPDCCGAKVAYNHNNRIKDLKAKKQYLENLPSTIKRDFNYKKVKLLGKAPFIAHLTDKMLYGSHAVYDSLIKNYKRKKLYRYKNPNSSNHINVYHINIPFEDNHKLTMYKVFLYNWLEELRYKSSSQHVYDKKNNYKFVEDISAPKIKKSISGDNYFKKQFIGVDPLPF